MQGVCTILAGATIKPARLVYILGHSFFVIKIFISMKLFGVFSGIIIVSVRMLLVDAAVFAGWDAVQIE